MKPRLSVLLSAVLLLILLTAFTFVSCDTEKTTPTAPGEDNENGDTSTPPSSETDSAKQEYTVTWINEVGETLAETKVKEGDVPKYTYTKADTAEWAYTFDGWSLTADGEVLDALPSVTSSVTYYAKLTATKRRYSLVFVTNGGSSVETQVLEYGAVPTAPSDTKYSGHRFIGWYADKALTKKADLTSPITADTYYYAAWNEQIDIPKLLESMLDGYSLDPYSYIPKSMMPSFSAKLVNREDIPADYSTSVAISDISTSAHGEQWQMVMENIQQSEIFFAALSTVEELTSSSVAAFNNYFDKNPADTAHHSFMSGIYTVTIDFDGSVIYYVLDYTADIPLLGKQTVQIALWMDIGTSEKNVRIQLGDANALTYVIKQNSYEFAIRYAGIRRAYFSIGRNERNEVEGHIYEYLTVSGAEIASSADIYINDEYISVVGNKASGTVGFTGYICELYDTESGLLLGYEVQEKLSSLIFNTLVFDLNAFSGISSIRYKAATEEDETVSFFLNGSDSAFVSKTVGGVGLKMFSRRFYIEYRTRYYYTYDAETEKYTCISASVPMLCVQEENFDTLTKDINEKNSITVTPNITADVLERINNDYDSLIPIFINNKELYTVDAILAFISAKVDFS